MSDLLDSFNPSAWRDRRVTIMGLGSFGGGLGATRFFVELGAHVTVTDKAQPDDLAESVAQLEGLPVRLVLGKHELSDFVNADLVVVSPAVGKDVPELAAVRKAGVALTTEMNIFFQLCRARIIGITGSNGKSTTTALVAHLLKAGGCTTWLGGNIGRSLLPEWEDIGADDLVVLELSSFQLDDLRDIRRSPHLAVVTNISPNHLDRHKTMEKYVEAKSQIVRDQTQADIAVLNRDDDVLRGFADLTPARVLWFSRRAETVSGVREVAGSARFDDGRRRFDVDLSGTRLIGSHNVENMLAAVCVAGAVGIEPETMPAALKSFEPLPHRLQFVGDLAGVRYYNDSIATTPESVIRALDSFECPIILIVGGYDKGIAFDALADAIVKKGRALRRLVLIGQTAKTIAEAVAARTTATDLVTFAEGLGEAVGVAGRLARAGDVVLLSPACASYDQFRNFEQRGKMFVQLVAALK